VIHGRALFGITCHRSTQSAAYHASVDGTLLPAVIHHLHWTLPLILIVYSRLDRGIQSPTEMLPSLEKGAMVVHSFNCQPPYGSLCFADTLVF